MESKSAQTCSTWNRCPSGFTCYSNYPDGRNAQCCTTVPLDNQVVFRANPQLVAEAAGIPTLAPSMQVAYSPPMSADDENTPTKNLSAVVIPAISLPANVTLIRCPQGTVNISGLCKRSMSFRETNFYLSFNFSVLCRSTRM
jgi:hypothetical protein